MEINDLVYIYMFDLNPTLLCTNKLVNHRFGKIKAIKEVDMVNSRNKALSYEIELVNGEVVFIASYDSFWNLIKVDELKQKVDETIEVEDKKERMLEQINNFINKHK